MLAQIQQRLHGFSIEPELEQFQAVHHEGIKGGHVLNIILVEQSQFVPGGGGISCARYVLDNLIDEFQPQGPLEEQLVVRVGVCMWRLRRLNLVEVGLFSHESLTIELDRAQDVVRSFEETESDILLASLKKSAHHGRGATSPSRGTGGEDGSSPPGTISGPRCCFQA